MVCNSEKHEYIGAEGRFCRWSCLHAGTSSVLYRSWFLHNAYYGMLANTLSTHRNALRWALFPSLPPSVELFFPAEKSTWVSSSWMMVWQWSGTANSSVNWQLSCARNKCVLLRLALPNSFQLFLLDDASLSSLTCNSAAMCFPYSLLLCSRWIFTQWCCPPPCGYVSPCTSPVVIS